LKIKLSVELIPKTAWGSNVRDLLSPKEWKALRDQVCNKANNVCEICGGFGPKHLTECHEIFEYDDKNHIQTLTGMISLCPPCHMVKHIGFAHSQGRYSEALFHFMKINDLKKRPAEEYIGEAFELWQERSQHQWITNLSYLINYGIDVNKLKNRRK